MKWSGAKKPFVFVLFFLQKVVHFALKIRYVGNKTRHPEHSCLLYASRIKFIPKSQCSLRCAIDSTRWLGLSIHSFIHSVHYSFRSSLPFIHSLFFYWSFTQICPFVLPKPMSLGGRQRKPDVQDTGRLRQYPESDTVTCTESERENANIAAAVQPLERQKKEVPQRQTATKQSDKENTGSNMNAGHSNQ